jgi:hypothetical protein
MKKIEILESKGVSDVDTSNIMDIVQKSKDKLEILTEMSNKYPRHHVAFSQEEEGLVVQVTGDINNNTVKLIKSHSKLK